MVRVNVDARNVEDVLKFFKEWLPKINGVYENRVRRDLAEEIENKEEALRRQKATERERQNVLAKLNI